MSNSVPQHMDGFASVFLSDEDVIPDTPRGGEPSSYNYKCEKRKRSNCDTNLMGSKKHQSLRSSALERLQRFRKKKSKGERNDCLSSDSDTDLQDTGSLNRPSLKMRIKNNNAELLDQFQDKSISDTNFNFEFAHRKHSPHTTTAQSGVSYAVISSDEENISVKPKKKSLVSISSDSDLEEFNFINADRGKQSFEITPHRLQSDSSEGDELNFPISPRNKVLRRNNQKKCFVQNPARGGDSDLDCEMRPMHSKIKPSTSNTKLKSNVDPESSNSDSFDFPISPKRRRKATKSEHSIPANEVTVTSRRSLRNKLKTSATSSSRNHPADDGRNLLGTVSYNMPANVHSRESSSIINCPLDSPIMLSPSSPCNAVPLIPLDPHSHDDLTPRGGNFSFSSLTDSNRLFGLDTPTRQQMMMDESFRSLTPPSGGHQQESGTPHKRSRRRKRLMDVEVARPDSSDNVIIVHEVDPVKVVEQAESDEAMARRLQEEMDREFAASLADTYHSPVISQPTSGVSSSGLPVMLGNQVVSPPSHRSSGRYISTPTRPRNLVSRHQSERDSSRRHDPMLERLTARLEQIDREVEMVMRMNSMTPYQFEVHNAVLNGEPIPDPFPTREPSVRRGRSRRRNSRQRVNIDHDFLNFMQDYHQLTRRPGRARGRGSHYRVASPGNDYEELLQLAEHLGDVKKKGLNQQDINRLPTRKYSKAASPEEDPTCNVCFCDFESGECIRMLPCVHEFHATCIDKWIKTNATCPICRLDVHVS